MQVRPYHPQTAFVEPLDGSGKTSTGLFTTADRRLPTVIARVTQIHPTCKALKAGDIIIHYQFVLKEVPTFTGKLYSIHETQCQALLKGYQEESDA